MKHFPFYPATARYVGNYSLSIVREVGEAMLATTRAFIAPPLLAAVVVYPFLTAFFTLIGLVGGYISGSVVLSLQSGVYWSAVYRAVQPHDIRECLLKALVFGIITTAICCHNGFTAHRR